MSLDAWRGSLTPAFEEEDRWGENRLLGRIYLTDRAPTEALVSSVRAVVFRGANVVVVSHTQGSAHVVPGGRVEPGETQGGGVAPRGARGVRLEFPQSARRYAETTERLDSSAYLCDLRSKIAWVPALTASRLRYAVAGKSGKG